MDDRDKCVWSVFTKKLFGKVFADRGYIRNELFESLFCQGIHLMHGVKANLKNKRYISRKSDNPHFSNYLIPNSCITISDLYVLKWFHYFSCTIFET